MARYMEVDGEIFRAVVTTPKFIRNPDYDWTRRDSGPAYIASDFETETTVFGPYARKGDATTRMNNFMRDGYGNPKPRTHGHVEKAHIVWEVVE